jgi:ketosteroid isomerase-like protein
VIRSRAFLLVPLFCALSTSPVQSAMKSSDEAQVIAAEHAWIDATLAGNADAMAGYMSDDYVELSLVQGTPARRVHWDVVRKASWVDSIRSKREKYESVKISDIHVYLHGEVATVAAYYTQKGVDSGKRIDFSGTYVNTWVKKGGRWVIVSSAFP